jgi:hypothetical protein
MALRACETVSTAGRNAHARVRDDFDRRLKCPRELQDDFNRRLKCSRELQDDFNRRLKCSRELQDDLYTM